ncbi:MAG: hypothetical protein IKI68_00535 [Clostridia bacterium]|nr:hypothetical protein [Clostridia bacterium]
MKKVRIISLVIALVLFSVCLSIPVSAGKREVVSKLTLLTEEGEVLNDTDWNITDSNIEKKGDSIVIPAQDATSDTKIISKTSAEASEDVNNISNVEMNLTLTALPADQSFILAFGLQSIEASVGEEGNIELAFTNDGSIKAGVTAYSGDGSKQLVDTKSCGIALNRPFAVKMALTSAGMLEVSINNASFANVKLPVSGEGRFGIMQTGSCGAVISGFVMKCSFYERPENTNIFEDFEDGEFNSNLFVSSSNDNGVFPSGVKIEDYNGNKVLRFQNTKLAHFCTLHQYSNFELSFDIPYYSRHYTYDEYGNIAGKPCGNLAVGFGEEVSTPVGYAYTSDVDLIVLRSDVIYSENQKAFRTELKNMNLADPESDEGYSFKLTVVDGHYDVAVKPLKSGEFKVIATSDFDAQRSGYVNIWSTGNGNFAVDNIKITNLDKNPNIIDVSFKSSKLKNEDYKLTASDDNKVFKTESESLWSQITGSKLFLLDVILVGIAVLLCGAGVAVYFVRKGKKKEAKNENPDIS